MSKVDISRPNELVFVRHGESEANVMYQIAKERGGRFPEQFRNKSNSEMELSPLGVEQAIEAGKWIRENINGGVFAQYYVSPFKRAMHTAGYLHLPEAETKPVWKVRDYIREQSFGHFEGLTTEEQKEKYPEIMVRKDIDGVYWSRLGGESMSDLVFRTKIGIIHTLYREVAGKNAIIVAHGNLLWVVRIIMEGLTYEAYHELDSPANQKEKMNNCQVLQYTRINPANPSEVASNFNWMRSVCPWDTSLSNNKWREIKRLKYTNDDLLS